MPVLCTDSEGTLFALAAEGGKPSTRLPSESCMNEPTILIVADECFQGELQTALRKGGYGTIGARDSAEACTVLAERRVDLVLFDVDMPHSGGMNMVAEIKGRDLDLRVIVCTAFSSEETKRIALDKGANGYLEKPIDVGVLRRLVEKMLTD